MAAPITDHVVVTISIDSVSVEQANFGTPMLLAYIPTGTQAGRVGTYAGNGGLTALVAAGFAVTDPVYLMASALLSQSPKVEEFKLGRLQAHTQDTEIEITTAVEDDKIEVTIVDAAGVSYSYDRTVASASSLTAEAVLLQTWVNTTQAITDLTATPTVENLQCVADTPGDVFYYHSNVGCNLTDETPDPGFATDLAAILTADDDWYAAGTDVNSLAISTALATWTEANDKLAIPQSQDSAIPTVDANDIASVLQASARARSGVIYTKQSLASYPAMAWLGKTLTKDPGSQTWAFKTLSGVTYDTFTATERGYLDAKDCNYYLRIAGNNITRYGTLASGLYIDIRRMSDWIKARVEEGIFGLMLSNDKLPYTDDTLNAVEGEIEAVYEQGAVNGGLVLADFTFAATAAASQAEADRDTRIMRGIQFGGTFTGAVHKMYITGVIE